MNISLGTPEETISQLLRAIDQPTRIKIILSIGEGEACVCHLEAMLGMRQAYISQHLMDLRKAEVLVTRREGRYIFYRLKNPKLLELIISAGQLSGLSTDDLRPLHASESRVTCSCPHCADEVNQAS